jgi:hypothetical protein
MLKKKIFKGKFTYVAFFDLKKDYDYVPIYNILIKLFHLDIRDKCFNFNFKTLSYFRSKSSKVRYLSTSSDEFLINRGVRQGCPQSPTLFNLSINDTLNN